MKEQKKPKLIKKYVDSKGIVHKYYDYKETEDAGIYKLTMRYTHIVYNEQDDIVSKIPVVEVDTNIDVDWWGINRMWEKCEIEGFKIELLHSFWERE